MIIHVDWEVDVVGVLFFKCVEVFWCEFMLVTEFVSVMPEDEMADIGVVSWISGVIIMVDFDSVAVVLVLFDHESYP